MKHYLKISTTIKFAHNEESMNQAFPNSDFYNAKRLAIATIPMRQTTVAIENILFNNKELFETRILAIFLAGHIRGQLNPSQISIKIQ
jgi:hypothetical protein